MSVAHRTKRLMSFLSLVLVFVVILSTEARAELYGFEAISNNSGVSGTFAQQLSVEVTDPGTHSAEGYDQVLFTFYNNALAPYQVAEPIPSVITEVFFDDGPLLGLVQVINSPPGVEFVQWDLGNASNLPGGNTLVSPFEATEGFGAEAYTPPPYKGVGPGESLEIVFNLGSTFADVINAINVGFNPDPYYTGSGDYDGWTAPNLRIGLHVQSTGEGGEFSDMCIMTPIPASVILGMLGLGVAGLKLRKFA